MKLTFVLADKCELENVNSQKFPSKKSQDSQQKFYFSSRNLASNIDR